MNVLDVMAMTMDIGYRIESVRNVIDLIAMVMDIDIGFKL